MYELYNSESWSDTEILRESAMKKIFMILALALTFTLSVFAAGDITSSEKDESKWTNLSYVNVPVLKILEGREGYVIIYQKNKVGTASTVIPKKWVHGNNESPRKLKFRAVRKTSDSYMTVVKEDGNFKRVILNIPMNKQNRIWGLVNYHKDLEGTDKETLEELTF